MAKLLEDIPKRQRVLVKVLEDGSAKTFVYKDLDEANDQSSKTLMGWLLKINKKRKRSLDLRKSSI
jgi:hypothetical protein